MEYITAPPSRDPPQLTAELQKRSRQLDNLENSLLTTSSELKKLKENHAETLKVGFLEASTATECASQWFFRGEAAPCSFRDGGAGALPTARAARVPLLVALDATQNRCDGRA